MTTERIDHAAKARSIAERYEKTVGTVTGMLELAQVHATLARVEQQRIANLIALAEAKHRLLDEQVATDAANTLARFRPHEDAEDGSGWHEPRPDIAAALGIQDGA